MSILEGELAETISSALMDAGIPYGVTLTRAGETVPGPNPWDPPVVTPPQVFEAKGFVETYSDMLVSAGVVQALDRKIVVLAPTLNTTPELTDTVTVRGQSFTIVNISFDPALATIELQARA